MYGVCSLVPVPGIEVEVSSSGNGGLLGLFNVSVPHVHLLSVALLPLVLVRGALALAIDPTWDERRLRLASRLAFGAYLVLALGAGFLQAWTLEAGSSPLSGVPIVVEPGWGFRLVATVTLAGGATIAWALASWVTRRGVAHGTLVLVAAAAILAAPNGLWRAGADLAGGRVAVWVAPFVVASAFAPAIVLAVLAHVRITWPLSILRGVAMTTPVDAALAPALPAAVSLGALGGLASFVVAMGVAGFLFVRGKPGGDLRLWIGAVAIPAIACALVAGGVFTNLGPRPFAGEGTFEVVVVSETGHASEDAVTIRTRLEALGVDADVRPQGDRRLAVRLDGVRSAAAVLGAVLPPRRLAFHLVAADQRPLGPDGIDVPGLRTGSDDDGSPIWIGPTAESLAPIALRVAPSPDRIVAIECREAQGIEAPAECSPWLLEAPPILTDADVAEASVQIDESLGTPNVSLAFSAVGAARLADVTGASVNRKLAIVVDGRIQSAPVIRERIGGGRAQVTMGGSDASRAFAEAQALAAALSAGSLRGDWRIETLR